MSTIAASLQYKEDGSFAGYNPCAIIALFIGAGAAFMKVELAWVIGFIVAGISYILLMKFAYKDSKFKKGTIFEENSSASITVP